MATDLFVHGPYEVAYTDGGAAKLISTDDRAKFIKTLEEHGVAEKYGCYIFALRTSKGYMPWYVGKAARPLAKECMGSYQLVKYLQIFATGVKGTPVMFFVCPEGTKKVVDADVIDEIETTLIRFAEKRNPNIYNFQKREDIKWSIAGVLHGAGKRPSQEETEFKQMMGIGMSKSPGKAKNSKVTSPAVAAPVSPTPVVPPKPKNFNPFA